MGEAKRRKSLGLSPRKKNVSTNSSKQNLFNNVLSKYPYLLYIFGFSLFALLIIDLINYYK
tara:strand:- start:4933 stop:5115 length:183 start_codon:yes stop_codon:yes gene_type:complete